MIGGVTAALLFPVVFPELTAINGFPFILIISGVASVVVSLRTPPENEKTLKSFYSHVRPWGFWGPVYKKVVEENPGFEKNMNFRRDMVNVAVGIVWQLTLALIPIYFIIREYRPMWISIAVLAVTSVFLKFNWYEKLERT